MGVVYEARHTRLPTRFAIKVMGENYLKSNGAVARFNREAEIAAQLKHPHIVDVIDFNTGPRGQPYIVMEYLEGETLEELLMREQRLSIEQAVRISEEVAAALAVAHRRGVIHRDLKPANIFLCQHDDRNDYVKVVDFGISKIIGSQNTLTGELKILGTPWYLSPEHALGKTKTLDGRTDIFALGAIVYEMLAGRRAFDGELVATVVHDVAYTSPPVLSAQNEAVTPLLEQVILRALAKDPEDRYQAVDDFAADLRKAASGETIPALTANMTAAGTPRRSDLGPTLAPTPVSDFALARTQASQQIAHTGHVPRRRLVPIGVALAIATATALGTLLFVLAKRDKDNVADAKPPAVAVDHQKASTAPPTPPTPPIKTVVDPPTPPTTPGKTKIEASPRKKAAKRVSKKANKKRPLAQKTIKPPVKTPPKPPAKKASSETKAPPVKAKPPKPKKKNLDWLM